MVIDRYAGDHVSVASAAPTATPGPLPPTSAAFGVLGVVHDGDAAAAAPVLLMLLLRPGDRLGHHLLREVEEGLLHPDVVLGRGGEVVRANGFGVPEEGRDEFNA